jgi:hypothetical protein
MIYIFLGAGIFMGIMIPTLLASAFPKLTIKILELFKIYSPGTLTIQMISYVAGDGYFRNGKVYIFNDETHSGRFDNGRVFGYLILGFVPVMMVVSLFAFFIFLVVIS